MRKSKIFLYLFFVVLLQRISYSENILPKLFGSNRGDEKKCIIISSIYTDTTIKNILGSSFRNSDGVYGKTLLQNNLVEYILNNSNCEERNNDGFYNRSTLNVATLLGEPNNKDDGILGELKNYSIIYFEAHSNVGGMTIEHYLSEDETIGLFAEKPDPSILEKEKNDLAIMKAFYDSKYVLPGDDPNIYIYNGSLGWKAPEVDSPSITYAGSIGISTDLFERELPDLNNALVILGSCYGSRLVKIFLNKGASIVIANTATTEDTSIKSILDSLCGLAYSRINFTVFEVYSHFCNNNETLGWKIYSKSDKPESMDYVLYRQPRIESVVIESENQKTKEKKLIYNYKFPKDQNPQDNYPNEQLIISAQESCPDKDKILYAKIEFSDPININKKATELKKTSFGNNDGYLFRLYACPLKKITDENKNYAEASNLKFVNNSTVTMTFDISKLNIESNPIVHLVVRALDTLNHDSMYYLDTIGRGREDNMAECVVTADDKCIYQNGGIDFNDGLDINHWFDPIIPQFTIKKSEINKLHLPLIKYGPPPDDENEQPLASDGFVVYPEDEYNRFAKCYSMLPNSVSSTYCIMDVSQQISSEYMPAFYLNKELLGSGKAVEQKKTIGELPDGNAAIISLKTMNYPSYVASLRTEATGQKDKQNQCVPLSAAGEDVSTLRPFISLKLKNYEFVKGSGSRGENYPGSKGTEVNLSDKYDLYVVKGNPCDIVVSLPLKRVFGENIEAYEGKNVLSLETTNGGIDTGREVYSSQSLEFIKSVKPPVNEGAVHGSRRFIRVSDPVSGFDNNHIIGWIANRSSDPKVGGYVFNMAHNFLDLGPLPETSPTSKATPAPKDESVGGGEIHLKQIGRAGV